MQRISADLLQTDTNRKTLGQVESDIVAREDAHLAETKRAREQQEKIYRQAHEQGLSDGLKDAEQEIKRRVQEIEARLSSAHQKALAELASQKQLFEKLLASMKSSIEQYASESETVAVEVAFASVLRLLGDKSADRSLMSELCRAIASEYGHATATLHVSEADSQLFESVKIGIDIEVDRRLKSGQCIMETSRGQFDCGLDVRLEALKKAFLSGLNEYRELK